MAIAMFVAACAGGRPDGGALPRPSSVATDWSRAEALTVTMAEYRFVPNQLRFRRGLVYRLHLENVGTELHEFTAPAFLAAIDLRDPAVLAAGKNEIVVAPGKAKDVYFVARQPGDYALTCADHDWAGMTGTIAIE
jgi:uncharacterized cupredoxin-like copper-binding protein